MSQLTNSQNDIFIINQSINDEDFSNDSSGLFDVTLSINTNKSYNLIQRNVVDICDYKIDINNNVYSDSKQHLLNIFNDKDSKDKLLVDAEKNVNDTVLNISQIKEDIVFLQDYFNNKSIVKEFYNIFIENRPSRYFGKFSNYIIRNIINYTESIDSFTENNYFKSDQKNYFDFLDYSLINDKTKSLFLYDVREENIISSNFNVETFICQNFLNLTQSLSVLSQGIVSSYLNITNENFVKLDGKNNNICETVDSSDVNYFKYISEDSFTFNNTDFSNQEIDNPIFLETLLPNEWIDKGKRIIESTFGIAAFTTTNILKVNAKRKIPLYPDFYKLGSSYDFESGVADFEDGFLSNLEVLTKPAIEQVDKALTDIRSVNLNILTRQNHARFNNFILDQILNKDNDIYRTDLNSGLTRQQFTDIQFFDAVDVPFYINDKIKTSVTPSGNCIANQVLSKNLSKNIGMIYINDSLSTKSILPAEPFTLESMSGSLNRLELKGFDYNNSFCNNTIEHAIKIDALVKKIKIKSLKEKNINLDTFKEMLKNIKNKKTISKIVSFTTNNLDNVQLTKEGENLQKIITTNSNNNTYSNFSLINNESNINKVKSIVEKVYDNVENSDIEFENEKINSLIKNYYSGSYFKTSSVFLRKILDDLLLESNEAVNDVLFAKKSLNQYIYLKYMIDNDSDQETKEIIAKRFLEKSIIKHLNCSDNLKSDSRFKFKFKNIDIDSYEDQILTDDNTFDLAAKRRKKNQVNKFYNDLEKTNDDYRKISRQVFSQRFLEKISNEFNYKKVDNINIRLDARDAFINKVNNVIDSNNIDNPHFDPSDDIKNIVSEVVGEEKFEIRFNVLGSHLPFYYTKYKSAINEKNKTGIKALSNKIKIERYSRLQTAQQSNELILSSSTQDNITKISKFIYFQKNNIINNIGGQEITDLFDKIIDNDFEYKSGNYIFSKITDAINDLIKTVKSNIAEIKFENQDDINSFLDANKEILDLSYEIISHYAVFYDYYIRKMHHETAIKLLSYDLAFADNVDVAESEYNIFNLIPNSSLVNSEFRLPKDVRNTFLQTKNESVKTKQSVNDILSQSNIDFIFRGISRIKDNLDSYENVKSLNKHMDPEKTNAVNQIENISSILTHSDVYQAINFDVIKLILNFYKYNISVIEQEEIDNRIKKINFINGQKLSSNLFNTFYLNKINENLDYLLSLNSKFLSNISSSTTSDDFTRNDNSFINILRDIENKNHELLVNEDLDNSILNGDLYNINLSLKEINSINKENLIKVKLNIIDHNRLDRVFLPKILLFSPLIFDPSTASITNDTNKLGFYNASQGSDNRQAVEYYQNQNDILENEYLDFIINNKVNEKNIATPELIENVGNKNLIFRQLANCHVKSNKISKVIYTLHNINMNEKNTLPNISQEVFKIIDNMSEEKFIDIFEKSKDEILSMFKLNSDSTYSLKFDENNYSIALLLDSVNKITSKEFLKKLLTLKDYTNINFEILPEDFVYIVQSLPNDDVESDIENVDKISYDELSEEQKVSCLFENIDKDFLGGNKIYKINNSNAIDNYSISVDIEVI